MYPSPNLPPELEMFSHIVDGQPPAVRELFHYALVTLLVENGKAEITERKTIDARQWVTIRTTAGDLFSIVVPDVSKELLAKMIDMARDVMREESGEE